MTQSVNIDTQMDLNLTNTTSSSSTYTISGINSPTTITTSSGHVTLPNTYSFGDDIISSTDINTVTIVPRLWSEILPDVYTVNEMCNEYPALAKAYENFKTVYKLVEQDYKGKQEGQSEFNF